ncbi:MAG: 16S rRNA (guanine(527)-N(7))-methyltransferase RsmG [Ardenticatenaceae bacterium]|nr:16S rRNA (guanine(527)-N(7))-methyltransferase RsmG [Ardenticatenaceae bacterium]
MRWLAEQTAVWGLTLSDEQLDQFAVYQRLLLAWNERMNLTAVRQPNEIQERHFLDSLTCATVTGDLGGCTLIDVGTGAGFPGMPLKILFPKMQLVLVDSVAKKTQFLQAVAAELGLAGVQIVAERGEVLGQSAAHRERYDWVVARGVATLRVLVEYLLPLARVGGHVLAQKGSGVEEEVAAAQTAVHTLGGAAAEIYPVQLLHREHYLVKVAKVRATPGVYPRRVGVPGKRPL